MKIKAFLTVCKIQEPLRQNFDARVHVLLSFALTQLGEARVHAGDGLGCLGIAEYGLVFSRDKSSFYLRFICKTL